MRLGFSNVVSVKIIKDFFNDFIEENKNCLHRAVLDIVSFIRKNIQNTLLYNYQTIKYLEIQKEEDYVIICIVFNNTNTITLTLKYKSSLNIKVFDNINNILLIDRYVSRYSSIKKVLTTLVFNCLSLKTFNVLNPLNSQEKDIQNTLLSLEEKIKWNIVDYLSRLNFLYDLSEDVYKNTLHSIKLRKITPKISLNREKDSVLVSADILFSLDNDIVRNISYMDFIEFILLHN